MKNVTPYQIFFPLGILNALLAVSIWFVRDLAWFSTPAVLIHSKLIMGGFLWSFIVGFLMTAVPRMTGTSNAHPNEYAVACALIFGQMLCSWSVDSRWFYGLNIALILFMFVYGARRLIKTTKPAPVFFSHVGLAMILALTGAIYYFLGNSFMGIHLYHVGTVLLLILGIGTRFFSFLSGLPSVFENINSKWQRRMFHLLGGLVAILLFVSGKGIALGYLGLTLLSLVYLFIIWKIQRPSSRPSALKHGMRIVAAMIPLSFFLSWLQPTMYITWFHLLFIGCFGLITFSVATRVILAHGSYPLELEMKSRALWWFVAFLILGLISRILYGISMDFLWRKSFLHAAASFWVLAILVWCGSFLVKIFKPGTQAKPGC